MGETSEPPDARGLAAQFKKTKTTEKKVGAVLASLPRLGSRAQLDPCPLSGALRTQAGHALKSEKCQQTDIGARRQGGREAGERVAQSVSCQNRPARKPDILGERQDVS
jgi:hypothetical protein